MTAGFGPIDDVPQKLDVSYLTCRSFDASVYFIDTQHPKAERSAFEFVPFGLPEFS